MAESAPVATTGLSVAGVTLCGGEAPQPAPAEPPPKLTGVAPEQVDALLHNVRLTLKLILPSATPGSPVHVSTTLQPASNEGNESPTLIGAGFSTMYRTSRTLFSGKNAAVVGSNSVE